MSKNKMLAERLAKILTLLNKGSRIDIYQLAEQFDVSVRTIQRDINERFGFLEWKEKGARYYQLNLKQLGLLNEIDIQRFANFSSVSELFPKLDREFFQNKLTESVQVKGFEYEDIHHLHKEFDLIQKAISQHQYIDFNYTKSGQNGGKFYKIAPYALLNKNGIWYLIGSDHDKQKTFCFTQMSMLRILPETFAPNEQFLKEIKENDSISHGNQISEVIIKVSKFAAPYFLRRNLLPNQKLLHSLDDGGLLLASHNVNEMDIIPLVQYWIPHLEIINPVELQGKMIEKLQNYLANKN
ncbi:helix-turn-helix transcriptional regulator [Pasteurellaceae bacterium 22721_9_1]